MSWPTIFLTPTMQASLTLRRLSFDPCPAHPYKMDSHDARTLIGITDIHFINERTWKIHEEEPPHTDPRWPTQCTCGYIFKEDDFWQIVPHRLYSRSDTVGMLTLREATAGMFWDATWLIGVHASHPCGPDGRFLIMKLPDGRDWAMDGPATNGPGWTRTGTLDNLTVTPSILSTGYHGYLTNGILTDDLDGRTYDHIQ